MTNTESTPAKPSLNVLEKIADKEGVPLAALEPPLNDVVDPVALDRSFDDCTERYLWLRLGGELALLFR